jgi:hypothetical protein
VWSGDAHRKIWPEPFQWLGEHSRRQGTEHENATPSGHGVRPPGNEALVSIPECPVKSPETHCAARRCEKVHDRREQSLPLLVSALQ